jgi:hypothetical protein
LGTDLGQFALDQGGDIGVVKTSFDYFHGGH